VTSYRHPDYDLALSIELSTFHLLSGTAFSVSVAFGQETERAPGMVIIPQGNKFPEVSDSCEAWLWMDDRTDLAPRTKVDIQIIRPDDPMLTPDQSEKLLPYLGTHLMGTITRNWNSKSSGASIEGCSED
jgi:hypothetical protein